MSENNGRSSSNERPPVEFADWIYEDIELLRPNFPDDGVPECSPHGKMRALDRDNYECYCLMRELLKQYCRGEIDRATFDQRQWDLWDLSIGITEATQLAFEEAMAARWGW